MSRAAGTLLAAGAILFGGCGVGPSDVQHEGDAPTGLADGTALFFLDDDGTLRSNVRDTGRLGTVLGAVQLLISGVARSEADDGLHTEVPETTVSPSIVDAGDHVTIRLPFHSSEITSAGVDQIVCTALGVVVASGRDPERVEVAVNLTDGSLVEGSCPVLG